MAGLRGRSLRSSASVAAPSAHTRRRVGFDVADESDDEVAEGVSLLLQHAQAGDQSQETRHSGTPGVRREQSQRDSSADQRPARSASCGRTGSARGQSHASPGHHPESTDSEDDTPLSARRSAQRAPGSSSSSGGHSASRAAHSGGGASGATSDAETPRRPRAASPPRRATQPGSSGSRGSSSGGSSSRARGVGGSGGSGNASEASDDEAICDELLIIVF